MALPASAQEFSPSERIEQLNAIDKDVALLLHSAGTALKSLTNKPPPPPSHPSPTSPSSALMPSSPTGPQSPTLATQKTAFTSSVRTYFALLSSIDVRLRRQVYALEEANIIAPLEPLPSYATTGLKDGGMNFGGNASGSAAAGSIGSGRGDEIAGVEGDVAGGPKSGIYGGQGALGVGELNGRVDGVGRDMERELWGQARGVVKAWEKYGDAGVEEKGREEVDSMEIDEKAS